MRSLPFAILAVALWISSSARAQSFFAFDAPIAPEGTTLGELHDAPVTIVRWTGPREALIRYEDGEMRIETSVELGPSDEPRTRIAVGVGRSSHVGAGAWRVTMDAQAWAPLHGRSGRALRIALPPGFPSEEGLLAAEGNASGRPSRALAHAEHATDGLQTACTELEIRASRGRGAPRWQVPFGALYRTTGERAPFAIEVRVEGFVITGYVDAEPEPCLGRSVGIAGHSVHCAVSALYGLGVRVPAGTPLYAGPTASAPFAWTHREIVAREQIQTPRGMACRSGVGVERTCHRVPPAPTGPQTLFFESSFDDGDWRFSAHVRVPFESLELVEGVSGTTEYCTPD